MATKRDLTKTDTLNRLIGCVVEPIILSPKNVNFGPLRSLTRPRDTAVQPTVAAIRRRAAFSGQEGRQGGEAVLKAENLDEACCLSERVLLTILFSYTINIILIVAIGLTVLKQSGIDIHRIGKEASNEGI